MSFVSLTVVRVKEEAKSKILHLQMYQTDKGKQCDLFENQISLQFILGFVLVFTAKLCFNGSGLETLALNSEDRNLSQVVGEGQGNLRGRGLHPEEWETTFSQTKAI